MKSPHPVFLLLLVSAVLPCALDGCMTSIATVNKARGKYTWPDKPRDQMPPKKPEPVYYALLPVTVPFDVITSPFQLPLFIMWVTMPEPSEDVAER